MNVRHTAEVPMSDAHSKYEVDDLPSNLSVGALSSTPLPPGSSCLERWEQPNHMLFQLAHAAVLLSFLAPNTTYGLLFLHSMLVVGRCRCHLTVRTLLESKNAYKKQIFCMQTTEPACGLRMQICFMCFGSRSMHLKITSDSNFPVAHA